MRPDGCRWRQSCLRPPGYGQENAGARNPAFDGESVKVEQSVWGGNNRVGTPKTQNAYRVVDLNPGVGKLLSPIVHRQTQNWFHLPDQRRKARDPDQPLAAGTTPAVGQPQNLPMRLSRVPSLLEYVPPTVALPRCAFEILDGPFGRDMSDLYDKSSEDLTYRRDVAKAMGVGFELPKTLTAKPSQGGLMGVTDVSKPSGRAWRQFLANHGKHWRNCW